MVSTTRDYSIRPADVKHATLATLIDEARNEQQRSKEAKYCLGDMRAVADGDSVKLASSKGVARFTHWSFGQLARMVGAPASYLRELPAQIAADALNHGLHTATPPETPAVLLVRAANGSPEPVIRSVTTKTYGRLWDADYLNAVNELVARHSGWEVQFATRSDRDSVITISNKNAVIHDPSVTAIVNDPQREAGDIMYRSLTIGNSETGAGSAWYEGGLYRARCKNLMLWSAVIETRYRRRHVGSHVLRDVVRELARFATNYLEQSPERDEAIIRQLVEKEVATTKDGVISELRGFGATVEQANAAYAACEMWEPSSLSPRSFWGIAQGLTRNSQAREYTDGRIELDRLAAQVLQRGARQLVAA
jgi:hypothetical protein